MSISTTWTLSAPVVWRTFRRAHGTLETLSRFFSKVSQSQYGKLWEVGFETCWVLNVHDPNISKPICFPHLVKSENIIEFTMVCHMFVHGFCWLVGGESYHSVSDTAVIKKTILRDQRVTAHFAAKLNMTQGPIRAPLRLLGIGPLVPLQVIRRRSTFHRANVCSSVCSHKNHKKRCFTSWFQYFYHFVVVFLRVQVRWLMIIP